MKNVYNICPHKKKMNSFLKIPELHRKAYFQMILFLSGVFDFQVSYNNKLISLFNFKLSILNVKENFEMVIFFSDNYKIVY